MRRWDSETLRPKNWCDENYNNLEPDIDQWRHKIIIVYIVIEDETFQQTFVNKTIRGSLNINIHAYIDCGIPSSYTVFHRK